MFRCIGCYLFVFNKSPNDLIIETAVCVHLSSHFIVPELGPDVNFTYASHKAVDEYKEAKAVSIYNHLH